MRKLIIIFFSLIVCLFMASQVMAYQPFPDTGQTMCYDADHNAVSCDTIQPGDPYYGQDAHYQPRLPRSYTKLGHGGVVLSDSALHVDEGGPWIMTRDNVTGLIWELKRNESPHLQDIGNTYTWYDPNPETNGGNAGTQNGGTCAGSDCDTYSYIQTLNGQQLGGFSDWRLPTREELSSLVNRGFMFPAIDTDFFPSTIPCFYWSSTTNAASDILSAWHVDFWNGDVDYKIDKDSDLYVRAVRSGQSPSSNFVDNGDGTVSDTITGLMWQKCSYGQTWEDGQCPGSGATMNWQQALEYAEGLNLGDYSDWRLPNINELQTLLDDTTYFPYIDTDFFPNTLAYYWSSTTYAPITDYALLVYFSHGFVSSGFKPVSCYVRAVRTVPIQPRRMSLPGVLMLLLDDTRFTQDLTWVFPVKNPYVSNGYGEPYETEGGDIYHTGIDVRDADYNKKSTSVYAIADGVVTEVLNVEPIDEWPYWTGGEGSQHDNWNMQNIVIIEHILSDDNEIYSLYAHLRNTKVKKGDEVTGGETFLGETGVDSRIGYFRHVHLEIKTKPLAGDPKSNSYWGYTPSCPNDYGYYNPMEFIDQ